MSCFVFFGCKKQKKDGEWEGKINLHFYRMNLDNEGWEIKFSFVIEICIQRTLFSTPLIGAFDFAN